MKNKCHTNNVESQVDNVSEDMKRINGLTFEEKEAIFLEECHNEIEDIIGEICRLLREMEVYMDNYGESGDVKDYYDTIIKGCEVLTGMG